MSCNLTKGRKLPCKNNIGGVSHIYLTKYQEKNNFVGVLGEELESIEATTFYTFDVQNTGVYFTESLQIDSLGDYYNINLDFSLTNIDKDTSNVIKTLRNSIFHVIVRTNDGKYYFLGFENGLEVTTLEVNSGTTKGDFKGFRISMQGKEKEKGMIIKNINNSNITLTYGV